MGRELQCVRRKIGKREAEVENGKNTRGNWRRQRAGSVNFEVNFLWELSAFPFSWPSWWADRSARSVAPPLCTFHFLSCGSRHFWSSRSPLRRISTRRRKTCSFCSSRSPMAFECFGSPALGIAAARTDRKSPWIFAACPRRALLQNLLLRVRAPLPGNRNGTRESPTF